MKNIIILACFLAISFAANSYTAAYTDDTCTGITVTATVNADETHESFLAECTADTGLSSSAGFYNAACSYKLIELDGATTPALVATPYTSSSTVAFDHDSADFATAGTAWTVGTFSSNVASVTGWSVAAAADAWWSTPSTTLSGTVNATTMTMITCTADESATREMPLGLSALTVVLF